MYKNMGQRTRRSANICWPRHAPASKVMPYLCSYRHQQALKYKHQLLFRLVHVNSTENSDVAKMRQLLSDHEFNRSAMETTIVKLVAHCSLFRIRLLYIHYRTAVRCVHGLYRPTAMTTGEIPDIYKPSDKTIPLVSSIKLNSKETSTTSAQLATETTSVAASSAAASFVATSPGAAPFVAKATNTHAKAFASSSSAPPAQLANPARLCHWFYRLCGKMVLLSRQLVVILAVRRSKDPSLSETTKCIFVTVDA